MLLIFKSYGRTGKAPNVCVPQHGVRKAAEGMRKALRKVRSRNLGKYKVAEAPRKVVRKAALDTASA